MFQKLYRKIYFSLFTITLLLIVLADGISLGIMSNTLYKTYRTMAHQNNEHSANNVDLYLSSIVSSAYNLAQNLAVTEELKTPKGVSLTSVLDDFCNYSLGIDAATVYAVNGRVYTSSKASSVPALAVLENNAALQNFFSEQAETGVTLRTSDIAKTYNNVAYPPESGVLSCSQKIYDGGKVIGYLFADILPHNIYSLLAEGKEEYFDGRVSFLSFGERYLAYEGNDQRENYLCQALGGSERTDDKRCLLVVSDCGYGLKLTSALPVKHYHSQILWLAFLFSGVSVVLVLAVHFIARKVALGVTSRLDALTEQMDGEGR